MIRELDHCLSSKEMAILPNYSHGLEYDNPLEFNKTVLGLSIKSGLKERFICKTELTPFLKCVT